MYKVIYDGPDDHLQGIISCFDEENGFHTLFKDKYGPIVDNDFDYSGDEPPFAPYLKPDYYTNKDKRLTMPIIRSGQHIMLNGPAKASIRATPSFCFDFYLFGVIYKTIGIKYCDFDPESFSAPLREVIVSDKGNRYLTILYALFERAAEACVKVKLCNFNSNSDIHLFGVIAAGTSAIKHPAYSSLLYFKDYANPGEKIQVRPGHDIVIPLSRNFVAVPLESELILEIVLFGDDREKIVVDTVTFPAKKGQAISESKPIKCSKGEIILEVSWRYERKPLDL